MKEGILVVNKPKEMTSFDVVAILRKQLGIKRIGHLGTLDPMATGVLPVALGRATRIMDYLDKDIKEYTSEFLFGLTSDTDDIWGNVDGALLSQREYYPTKKDIEDASKSFLGVIDQVPPKYAAIKVKGKKLYEYARQGENVDIKPRKMFIESMDLMDYRIDESPWGKRPTAVFKIRCSKGTYIRALGRDLGEMLGTGAVMSALERRGSGIFDISQSMELEKICKMESSEIEKHLIPVDYPLYAFPRMELGPWESRLFINGVILREDQWRDGIEADIKDNEEFPLDLPEKYSKLYRVYGIHEGEKVFLGLGLERPNGEFKADKVFIK